MITSTKPALSKANSTTTPPARKNEGSLPVLIQPVLLGFGVISEETVELPLLLPLIPGKASLLTHILSQTEPAEIGDPEAANQVQAGLCATDGVTANTTSTSPTTTQMDTKPKPKSHRRTRTLEQIWPELGLPWPVGYATYTFSQHDPAHNRHREYRLTYQSSLWQSHTVQRTWGRYGSQRPRHQDCSFESEEQALNYLRRLVLKRHRRGYTLNWCEGAVHTDRQTQVN